MLLSLVLAAAALVAGYFLWQKQQQQQQQQHGSTSAPPRLERGWPLLGCVQYMRDPVGFLTALRARDGAVAAFRLAGRNIVLLSDPRSLQLYYRSPEEVLNAHAAFADFGE